jgi:hypothetical protein
MLDTLTGTRTQYGGTEYRAQLTVSGFIPEIHVCMTKAEYESLRDASSAAPYRQPNVRVTIEWDDPPLPKRTEWERIWCET